MNKILHPSSWRAIKLRVHPEKRLRSPLLLMQTRDDGSFFYNVRTAVGRARGSRCLDQVRAKRLCDE